MLWCSPATRSAVLVGVVMVLLQLLPLFLHRCRRCCHYHRCCLTRAGCVGSAFYDDDDDDHDDAIVVRIYLFIAHEFNVKKNQGTWGDCGSAENESEIKFQWSRESESAAVLMICDS